MKTITRFATGGLLAATVFGFTAGMSGAAHAHSVPAAAANTMSASQVTRGFDIVNMTPYNMRLSYMENANPDDGAPAIGTIVAPGGSVRYEKVVHFLKAEATTLTFSINVPGPDNTVLISSLVTRLSISPFSDGLAVGEASDTNTFRVSNERSAVVLQMKERKVNTVPAGQGQEQAQVLNQLCGLSRVSCSFDPTSKTAGKPITQIVAWGANNMSTNRTETLTTAVNKEITQSVEVTATAKLAIDKVFEMSLSSKYGQTWKVGETITKTHTVLLSPYKYFTMTAVVPTQRVTGNFTVTLGNTTWILEGVSFDSPDPAKTVGYNSADRDLTAKEKAELPKDVILTPIYG